MPDTHIKILEDLCRQVRYRDATDPNLFHWEEEVYLNTRASSAFSLGGRYFVQPGSAVYGSARIFNDTWGVDAWDAQLGISYEIPVASWKFAERGTANFNYDLSTMIFAMFWKVEPLVLSHFMICLQTSSSYTFHSRFDQLIISMQELFRG